jgi:putative transposase
MKLYRQGPHTTYDLKYHLVWTTKYRRPILEGSLGRRIRELIREICITHSIQIIRGHVSKDHIHIFVSMPPQISVSKVVQYLKGKTSRKILQEYPKLNKIFWGQHFWSRGYFATTSGAITDEMIMDYIKHQDDDSEKRGDDFTILDTST